MEEIIKKLESLPKYYPTYSEKWGMEYQEDDICGEVILLKDIQEIINELKSKKP